MTLYTEDLKKLTQKFPDEGLGVKVQSLSKDRSKAMLVLYLQHTDVMNRLEEVDPAWTCTVLEESRVGDTLYVRMKMVVKGVERENVGEGGDPKSAYSDAIKRCAMLFGVGRYLYDSPQVWVPYNEQTDKYKAWTPAEYWNAARGRADNVRDLPPKNPGTDPGVGRAPETKAAGPKPNGASGPVGAAPSCPKCNGEMKTSRYPNKLTGVPDWYCFTCKVPLPRQAGEVRT